MHSSMVAALSRLSSNELLEANGKILERAEPKPKTILDLIGQFAAPKRSTLILFEPHPDLVQAGVDFKKVHIIEGNDTMRKLFRYLLNHMDLKNATCGSQFPENGQYNTIYVGTPFNKDRVRLLYVPSGALLIFRNFPSSDNLPLPEGQAQQETLTTEQKLSRSTFNSLVNAGFTLLYPYNTGSLSTSDFYILRKP